jgi:IS5 family transposase
MQARSNTPQMELFKTPLKKIINYKHLLCVLGEKIEWPEFDNALGPLYCDGKGRPGKPTRLMVGLHYLKRTYNLSDEEVEYSSYFVAILGLTCFFTVSV